MPRSQTSTPSGMVGGSRGTAYGWEVKEEAHTPYTPRRSARFDQQEVLGALMSAPPLPSPALTPRMLDLSQNAYHTDLARLDSSRSYLPPPITPRSGLHGFGAQPHRERSSPDRMERSSWLPSPRPSLGGSLKGAHYEASLDGSILSRQVAPHHRLGCSYMGRTSSSSPLCAAGFADGGCTRILPPHLSPVTFHPKSQNINPET
jgi:hypothetical protein